MFIFCTLPLFPPFLSEGDLLSAGPVLLQPLKLTEKFLLGVLDPAQSWICQPRL